MIDNTERLARGWAEGIKSAPEEKYGLGTRAAAEQTKQRKQIMPNPTRQEILDAQLARQWAEWNKSCEVSSPEIQAAANFILANTPAPTMAEVEWDDDEHHLAGANTHTGLDVVMMRDAADKDCIYTNLGEIPRDWLTPNRKRYELREISKPEHPETLTTLEDYENAPAGTIVAIGRHSPYMKCGRNHWTNFLGTDISDKELEDVSRKVLRWDWGEQP
ncbi:hypothetical protein [uncultured Corynebacterium sp.]|uniref:hypothetical protein n=1 Tax=uncultured Corynebacterium sp. TaxID=159447 RepID=UPI0025E73C32|nr:hypothetical protein [uncultured Corynebacterium sp.]